ncbi:MAG TPA: metallophosphoesterase [Bacteroides sp.]|nr:metallophosphoesterase [Bacteroides sp.]
MNRKLIFLLFTLFILIMDLYASRGIRNLLHIQSDHAVVFRIIYWGITLMMLSALVWSGSVFQRQRDPVIFHRVTLVLGIFLMYFVPILLFNAFQLAGDLTSGMTWLFAREADFHGLRKFFLIPGAIAGILLFAGFGMGMVRGVTNIKIFREEIGIPGLPEPFSGIRVVQISDFHLAGFHHRPDHIRKAVDLVKAIGPDLILFTGDMVHNFAEEMDPFMDILKSLKAPLGKYAILGNHDYGAYYSWNSETEKRANLEKVKSQVRKAGFDLLLNEHRTIALNGTAVELVGVENWGKAPMPQEGDLDRAMAETDPSAIKILLTHDPHHWLLHVRGRKDIPLTLSGHTHGFQFGFEIGKFKWSPSAWMYDHWAGLLRENGQYLYVNRGIGYTGFPGRVGIRPEITLLTLSPQANEADSPVP